jgi:hypothetical protein
VSDSCCVSRPAIQEKANNLGAQTERRGVAGTVTLPLSGEDDRPLTSPCSPECFVLVRCLEERLSGADGPYLSALLTVKSAIQTVPVRSPKENENWFNRAMFFA